MTNPIDPPQKTQSQDEQNESEQEQVEKARERVIHSIASNMDLYGITPSIGRLYGTMYFHNSPMTLDEMRDALEMSKTSMSTGVRSLMEINMVHKKWKKGVRKDLYEVEEDWYKTFIDLFTTRWRRGIEMNEEEIQKSREELQSLLKWTQNDEIRQMIIEDLQKLDHAIEYYDWLLRLVESFESGEIFDFIPKKSKATKDNEKKT